MYILIILTFVAFWAKASIEYAMVPKTKEWNPRKFPEQWAPIITQAIGLILILFASFYKIPIIGIAIILVAAYTLASIIVYVIFKEKSNEENLDWLEDILKEPEPNSEPETISENELQRQAQELEKLLYSSEKESILLTVCLEELYATRISHKTGKAILIHWGLDGDYSRALIIPQSEFEGYDDLSRVIEALEQFYDQL